MEMANALEVHYAWKAKLQEAADSGIVLDTAQIRKDNCCELGMWLYGDGARLHSKRPEFLALLEKHKVFHFATSIVAATINQRLQTGGKPLHLNDLRQFEAGSTAVGMAIIKLQKAME